MIIETNLLKYNKNSFKKKGKKIVIRKFKF